jgi:hypothetical protein
MFSQYLLKRRARGDAPLGVESAEDEIAESIGPRTEFDPTANAEHAEIQHRRQNRRLIEDTRADLIAQENEATRHTHPCVLFLAIAGTLVIEGLGGIYLIAATGAEGVHRLVFGAGLRLFIVIFTALVARRLRHRPDEKRSIARAFGTFVIVVAYTLMIATIAILRVLKSADESSLVEAILVGLVMTFVTCGPPWFVEDLLRKRKASAQLWSDMANGRRRIRVLERERAAAEAYVGRIARTQTVWDREAARIRVSPFTLKGPPHVQGQGTR